MRIEIIAKNYSPSDKLKEIIEKKVEKFTRYFDDEAIARVLLKEINKEKYAMEITINFGGGRIIRSEVLSDNMYDNIDLALPKLERQVRKYRTKESKKVKVAPDLSELLYTEVIDMKEPELVRTKTLPLAQMTITEAMDSLDMVGHDFYMFINADNNKVNAIYRRKDGDLGLLDLIY